ncbi:MAG: hypothetical protein HOQ21_14025, partial [Dermatophilaceae bacterium]|nr:hypothetical protein [Dermatophilaceae bacterium]
MTERATGPAAPQSTPPASPRADGPAGDQRAGSQPANASALLNEAMSKSGLLWIEVSDDRTWPAWHVWDDGAAL